MHRTPHPLLRVVYFVAVFVALASVAFAQSTGTIQGRVLNAGTQRYLNNARVQVAGTSAQVFTNQYGEYRVFDVPAGEATLNVFYTGLAPQTVKVQVPAGGTVTQDITIGAAEDTVVMEAVTVSSARDTNIAQIAVNEQRFAPNIKTVIESDAFGDVAEGNVGEFLKFLPGVTVDYVAADVRTVSVRGFGAAFSSVYVDGFRMASAASGGSIRSFEFEQVSINNAARIEVAKVPTPAMPADALGGSVNMISKNAFEREGAQFNYRAYLNMNSEDPNPFARTPGPGKGKSYKVLPGGDFDYTLPITKNVGLVITGLTSNQFNEQHRTQTQWNFAQGGSATTTPPIIGGTATAPYLQNYQLQDGPKNSFRDSFSAKLDWRISPESVLWVGYQVNYYNAFFGNRNLTWDAGTNGVPNPTSGSRLEFGPEFTRGATGRGVVRRNGSYRDKFGAANALLAKYRYNGRLWEFDAGLGWTKSKSWYRDTREGHFEQFQQTLQGVSRVEFADIAEDRPETIRALTAAGAEIDWRNLNNYRIDNARSRPLDASDEFRNAHANAAYDVTGLPFELRLRGGVDIRQQERDIRRFDNSWTFLGPDGLANTADNNAALFLDDVYGVYSYWGVDDVQWLSPWKLYDAFVQNPTWFSQTTAQQRSAEVFRINNSFKLRETVTSAYLQGEAKLLNNRLSLVGGVRFEKTDDKGAGPSTPTSGATLADIAANWRERGYTTNRSYDGYYPSLHATFNITSDLILRAAYAKTLGRPDFENILPLVTANLDENDPNEDPVIEYTNTALRPYEADNYDLSLEYYFTNGGVISVGAFQKNIEGFFETVSRPATPQDFADLGLDPALFNPNITVETTRNSARTSKISGVEFNFRQPLNFIPVIGRNLELFANATKLDLDGSAEADFEGFIEEAANLGVTYKRNPVTFRVNINYRGRQLNSRQTGALYGGAAGMFYEYYAPRFNVDMNAEYRFSTKLAAFVNVRNVFNESQDLERYNSVTPDYAKLYRREKFGAQITLGVKGTF